MYRSYHVNRLSPLMRLEEEKKKKKKKKKKKMKKKKNKTVLSEYSCLPNVNTAYRDRRTHESSLAV